MNVHDKHPDAIKSVNSLSFKIIVIEDDEGLSRLIQKKLQKEGYKTESALTGQEALTKTSGDKNEILLMDYKLPDMTGKQLTNKLIKKYHKAPPIIVITGFGDEKIAVEMMKLGVWDYMVKEPDFIDILPEKIKHLCTEIERNKKLEKAEDDLRKNLEILNDTGEMARVGGWEVDLEKNKVYWTQSTKKIHEVTEDFVPTLEEAINFFPGESKTRMEKALEKAIQQGTEYDMELQFISAKNNKLWVQVIGKPEMKDGKCVRLHGTFQDITPRIEAEKELKINHDILKRTEKIAHVGSWDWDVETDTVTWSDELFRIFKVNPENGAISYVDHPMFYTPESMKKLDAAVQECLDTGESYQLDLEIIRGDGSTAYCTVRGYGTKDKNGKVEKLYGTFQDITDRKEAEEELQKSEEMLSTVIDNSPFPVAVADEKDQNILYWSKSALQLFGHDPKTVEEWYELAYPDPEYRNEVIERWKPFIANAQNSTKAVNTGEYLIACKNGTVKICEIHAQFIPGSLIVTLNDITERKKAEEQLKALNQQLQASEQQLRAANQQLQANEQELQVSNQQLSASEQQLRAANQQLQANEQQLRAANQQLQANEQELQASNQQLSASEQQLLATNQQLQANEQQLRAANQQLIAGEKDLRDSKETAERYLNIAAEIILCLDTDGNITLLNESGYQLLGYEVGELLKKNWFSHCIPEEDVKSIKSVFSQLMKDKFENVANYESNIITKSGEIRTILWHNTVLKDKNGKITGTLSSGEDITERKNSERQIVVAREKAEKSEKYLENIIKNLADPIFVKDEESKLLVVNDAFCQLFGLNKENIIGKNLAEDVSQEERESFLRIDKMVLNNGKENINEESLTIRGGLTKTISTKKSRFVDEKGRKFIVGIIRDITERKQSEIELQNAKEKAEESEHRFRFLAENSQDMIYRMSIPDAVYEYVSPSSKEIFGYTPEEFYSTPLLIKKVIHPDWEEYFEKEWQNLIAGNNPPTYEYQIIHKSGEVRWLNQRNSLIKDEKGKPVAIEGSVTDVTEQKHIAEVLLAEKLFSDSLISSLPGVFYLISEEGRFLRWNKKFEIVTGRSAEEMARISPINLFEGEDKQAIAAAIQRVFNHGQDQVRAWFVAKDGKKTPYQFSGDKIIVDGKPTLIGLGFDITEQQLAEIELIKAKEKAEESEEKANKNAEMILSSQSVAHICSYSTNLKEDNLEKSVWECSPEFYKIFGIDETYPHTIAGWAAFIHPDHREKLVAYHEYVVRNRTSFNHEYKIIRINDGVERWVHGTGELVYDKKGKPVRMFGAIQDITELKKTEAELIKAKEKAEESDRLKSAFLANMSHEIRTPMNGILGFTDLLQEPNLTGQEHQKYVEIIQRSGDRMLSTVNDIIDISKIESGQVELSISKVNINEQLKELHSFFNPEAAKKGIKLTFKNDFPEQAIIIKTDLEKFNSIVTNLIKNAIKYSDKGSIELGYDFAAETHGRASQHSEGRASQHSEGRASLLQFYVKDSGIGIPKERQEAIFDRFVQADIEDKKAKQGSGLGLAISKAYAEMLGGEMWVESKAEKGSTFYFTIEYNAGAESKPVIENDGQKLKEDKINGNLKILIVEDDETSQELISIVVDKFAKEIIKVSSGWEAVKTCRNNPDIDLILMDIQLPNMNGYEATRQIRQFNKDVIILAQTAYALAGDKENAINMGCNDYISKPINKSELDKLINEYF